MEGIAVQAIDDARPDTLSLWSSRATKTNLGVILDCDAGGNLVSFRLAILDAPKRITEAHRIEFQTVG
jgi:hypothetical protein